MNKIPGKIARDYLLCVVLFGVGYGFGPFDSILPFSVGRDIVWLAIYGIGITTFKWAIIRGYPARGTDGRFRFVHIIRSILMTGVMTIVVFIASTPIFILVSEISRK